MGILTVFIGFSSANAMYLHADVPLHATDYPILVSAVCNGSPNCSQNLVASSTPYTILSYDIVLDTATGGNVPNLKCGSVSIYPSTLNSFLTLAPATLTNITGELHIDTNYLCSGNLTLSDGATGGQFFYAQALILPYGLTSTSSSVTLLDQPTYHDWLLALQWIIFILTFILAGFIFSPLRKK